ncbi:hypothetical protein MOUN0_N03642 [Monosporozyma unispora]
MFISAGFTIHIQLSLIKRCVVYSPNQIGFVKHSSHWQPQILTLISKSRERYTNILLEAS